MKARPARVFGSPPLAGLRSCQPRDGVFRGRGLSPLEQFEHVAPLVPNKLLALARHDDDDHRLGLAGAVDWLSTDLADWFLVGAHPPLIGFLRGLA